jgi:hypothetical protein
MGRTAPSYRMAVKQELENLSRLARECTDAETKRILGELLSRFGALENALVMNPLPPLDALLLSMLIEVYREVERLKKMGASGTSSLPAEEEEFVSWLDT